MKSIAFLAFLALAAAFEVGSYQPRQIVVSDGTINVEYQGWNIVLKRPVDNFNFVKVFVSGPNNFNRKVVIDNEFLVVKDYYLNNDYAKNYQEHYAMYRQQFGQYFGQTNFNQFEYLFSIFKQYVGVVDVQQWSQLLNTLQTEVQHGKVHFLIFEFFKNFGVNEEFFYGKYSSQFYGPYQYEGQHYGNYQSNYGKNFYNKLFGKYYENNKFTGISNKDSYGKNFYNNYYGQDVYGKKYDQDYYGQNYYGQQYYGPYNQQSYGQEFYGPYNQQYYGQEYSGPYSSQYYGQEYTRPYSGQYYGQQYQYGPYQQQYYGQQYQKGQYYPYQQYYGQYHSYPQYQGSYYGQQYGQNYQQYPSFWNKFVTAY